MILNLNANELLRLSGARGTGLEVLDGAVWVTQAGTASDALVGAGRRLEIGSNGLVMIGADASASDPARIALMPRSTGLADALRILLTAPFAALAAWIAAAHTRRELAELSDHALRDIGLTRDQIARL